MKKIIYFDVTGIDTIEDYYIKKATVKAINGIPQTRKEMSDFVENLTTSVIEELFRGDTVAVYKQGNTLIRIPKSAMVKMSAEEPKKKPGFLKRLWNKITGK